MGYNYTIRFKPTQSHANADALSRLPAGYDNSFIDVDAIQINFIQTQVMEQMPLKPSQIAAATATDSILKRVRHFALTKWPSSISRSTNPELIPYFNIRHSLSVIDGCILKDTQVIIPEQLRGQILQILHRTHLGTIKMKQLARINCWWPKIDKDIVTMTTSCNICAQALPLPAPQFTSWEEPKQVWSRVHVDFAEPIWNSKWLILIDAKSKFPVVADMGHDTTAKNLCYAIEQVIDWFGPPEILVSDNGPPFNSYEMTLFYNKYGIKHVTTAPYHPASNGIAERFVRTFKEGMVKEQQMEQTNKTIAVRNILRSYRWSPHTSTNSSPANMMFKHSVRTELDMIKPDQLSKQQQQQKQTKYSVGQLVWVLKYRLNKRPQWKPGHIKKIIGSMIYAVELSDGQQCKRHQNQLRPRFSSNTVLSETDDLPDDLLNIKPQTQVIQSPSPSTPRYPQRNRKPPDRYTPS